jgi:rRNA biogenesis protein RRP5
MLVELFGGMRAYVPISEAADHFVADIKKEFNIGQVIKVRITAVDQDAGRLTASAKQALDTYKPKSTDGKKGKATAKEQPKSDVVLTLSVGDKVSGVVSEIHESQVLLALEGHEGVKALLSLASLARNRSTDVDTLRLELTTGEELSNLVVVSTNPDKGLVILGHPVKSTTSLFPSAQNGISANSRPTLTFDDLEVGQVLEGTLGDQNPQGYFVQLAKSIRGKVRWSELGDDYDAVNSMSLQKGSVVKVVIIDYDKAAKKIDLSMRQSRLNEAENAEDEDAEIRDPIVESLDELEDGKEVRGFVRSISDAGVFVDLGKDLAARVQIKVRVNGKLLAECANVWL